MIPGLERALTAQLNPFLQRQRWFGGKARTILACQVEDVAEIGADPGLAVVVAAVSYADGTRERYGLLLAHLGEPLGLPVVGRVHSGEGWIVEAATDPAAAHVLLRGFVATADIPTRRGGWLRYRDLGDAAGRMLRQDGLPISAVGAEQSNTSVRVGPALVFKLFRRLEQGENPELEVGRFLTTCTSFRAMSTLEGSLTYVSPLGESSTLGVLQAWIDNDGDGWRYVSSALADVLRTGTRPPHLIGNMTSLGGVTAGLHAALESRADVEAFKPEPLLRRDIDAWTAHLRDRTSRALALVEAQLSSNIEHTRQLAAAVLSRVARASTVASLLSEGASDAFVKIRIHGDYHLGQTLKTPSGFAVVDFEGEPARSLADRRQKHCALKDVAGMLRSFDYAIDTACEHQREAADRLRMSLGLHEAFLEEYLSRAASLGATSVPADRRAIDRWLTFFELEKAIYELEYEVNNRPAWVHIPLRGILRALERPTA